MLGRAASLCAFLALALPAWASADGGNYTFAGGTKAERQTVVSALDASSFDRSLGGTQWCYTSEVLPHAAYGCERFASTLVWSYWPSPNNCLKPGWPGDESAALPPRRFRALLGTLLLGRPTGSTD